MSNKKMNRAKGAKNDEFYTKMEHIEAEVPRYGDEWAGAHVYSNCDDHTSQFVFYFEREKERLRIPRYYHSSTDFRSPDNIGKLMAADIIVTNPPFSLFREFFDLLMEKDKPFLIIGNVRAVMYKNVFPEIQAGRVWLGASPRVPSFNTPEGERTTAAYWYTNMKHDRVPPGVDLSKHTFNSDDYPKYDNHDAIEVKRTALIPGDYLGKMGVPVTYIEKHAPDQFDIVGSVPSGLTIKGKEKDARLMIRRKM